MCDTLHPKGLLLFVVNHATVCCWLNIHSLAFLDYIRNHGVGQGRDGKVTQLSLVVSLNYCLVEMIEISCVNGDIAFK